LRCRHPTAGPGADRSHPDTGTVDRTALAVGVGRTGPADRTVRVAGAAGRTARAVEADRRAVVHPRAAGVRTRGLRIPVARAAGTGRGWAEPLKERRDRVVGVGRAGPAVRAVQVVRAGVRTGTHRVAVVPVHLQGARSRAVARGPAARIAGVGRTGPAVRAVEAVRAGVRTGTHRDAVVPVHLQEVRNRAAVRGPAARIAGEGRTGPAVRAVEAVRVGAQGVGRPTDDPAVVRGQGPLGDPPRRKGSSGSHSCFSLAPLLWGACCAVGLYRRPRRTGGSTAAGRKGPGRR